MKLFNYTSIRVFIGFGLHFHSHFRFFFKWSKNKNKTKNWAESCGRYVSDEVSRSSMDWDNQKDQPFAICIPSSLLLAVKIADDYLKCDGFLAITLITWCCYHDNKRDLFGLWWFFIRLHWLVGRSVYQ